jgi:hypothetical protein
VEAAQTLGIELAFFNASTPAEIDAAFAAIRMTRFVAGVHLLKSRAFWVEMSTRSGRKRGSWE